mmetsp:Transcript_13492/g.25805  ORF Transcript_13492/g.25805 Transcript_13492/m.25805 type:complete len:212 (-) Transcript_13492:237-872(-)
MTSASQHIIQRVVFLLHEHLHEVFFVGVVVPFYRFLAVPFEPRVVGQSCLVGIPSLVRISKSIYVIIQNFIRSAASPCNCGAKSAPHVRTQGPFAILLADFHCQIHLSACATELDEAAPHIDVWHVGTRRGPILTTKRAASFHVLEEKPLTPLHPLSFNCARAEKSAQNMIVDLNFILFHFLKYGKCPIRDTPFKRVKCLNLSTEAFPLLA